MNWVTYTLFGITAVSSLIGAYRLFSDPDHSAKERLSILENSQALMSGSIERIITNHLPHMDAKISDVHNDVSSIKGEILKLATIIDERIPKKS